MNGDLLLVLALLAGCVGLFVLNRPRMDVVALLAMVALPLTGVLSVQEALAGFSDPSVVLIAALFVIGDGSVRTGIAYRLGDWLMRAAGSSETRLLVLLMLAVAGLGSVMSSTGVVAIFIPVVLGIANRMKVSPRRLLMPLAFAGLISGMLTLGDAAEPGGQQRTAPRRPRGLRLLRLHAHRPGDPAARGWLHAAGAALARFDKHGPAVERDTPWPISREITGSTSASDACACCPARSWPIRHWTPCGCAASTAST